MKNYQNLQKLGEKLFFTVNDVERIFGITHPSAWVLCSRYVKEGLFIRLKNNFYVLDINWDKLTLKDFFRISNFTQTPSYISFLTALSYYGVTTQVQRHFFESTSSKRSKTINAKNSTFNFYRINKKLYFGFLKEEDFFIATPEKAFADALYFFSLGRYSLDFASLDLSKINKKKLVDIIEVFPAGTQNIYKRICRI